MTEHPRRSELAHHWDLDPTTVFLNHGSFGACPRVVLDAQRRWQDQMEREPVRFFERDVADALAVARAALGGFVHCDPEDLAFISNDPSFELDSTLSKSINYDSFEPMVAACKASGGGRFIYASTSSVYGVSEAPEVTEDFPLVPLSDYNKYKGLCEPILLRYQSQDFTTVIIRPVSEAASRIAPLSMGLIVCMSNTLTPMPFFSSLPAASSEGATSVPVAMMVRS